MRNSHAIIGMVCSLAVGIVAGGYLKGRSAQTLGDLAAAAQPDPSVDRYRVPLGHAPYKGGDNAKVTIVEYSDFQCPFCGRVEPTIDQIMKTYGRDVKVVWKNSPLPFHQNALPAAELAMAAAQKGKFWQMHDTLFQNQQALDRARLEQYGKMLGLDDAAIKDALDGGRYAAAIKADQEEAAKLGALGTPSFFIDGRPLSGAQPFAAFKKVIDEEMANADKAIRAGVALSQVYDALTRNGKTAVAVADHQRQRSAQPDDHTVYKAQIGDAPVRGSGSAKVTIVEYSDFQCPFCGRVEPTIAQVLDAYKNDVRVVFKQLALPFHQHAHLAAEASLAAKAQGKFWQMHDKLFANQQALDRASLDKYAQEIGLNMNRFKSDLDHGTWKHKVDAELAEGSKIGARGTPSFFINGKALVGAQPFAAFKTKIDAELAQADAMVKKGTPVAKIYDALMKDAKAEAAAPPAPGARPVYKTVYEVDAGRAPSVGPKSAPVTIVEFSDFQCPFCGRVVPTVKEIEEKYKGRVRFAFRNYPLPFHQNAELAAEAAMAANEQGKFWAMHDKLFANQQALDRASLERYAGEIGLNVARFNADLDSGKYKTAIDADRAYANGLGDGGFGTPTFFINGRRIAGAMPLDSFSQVIDEELKKAGARPEHAAIAPPTRL